MLLEVLLMSSDMELVLFSEFWQGSWNKIIKWSKEKTFSTFSRQKKTQQKDLKQLH